LRQKYLYRIVSRDRFGSKRRYFSLWQIGEAGQCFEKTEQCLTTDSARDVRLGLGAMLDADVESDWVLPQIRGVAGVCR